VYQIGVLKLNYLQKQYLVTLNTFQISILLLFEDNDTIKYVDISKILQLTNNEIQKHINTLVESKLLLLDGDVSKLFNFFLNFKHSDECIDITMVFFSICYRLLEQLT